jgi:DUF438 domain-containing protein
MSEFINNHRNRMDELKEVLKKLNSTGSIESVKMEISEKLKTVPYEDVLAVEQELISEGMPSDKMLELCDLHSNALSGLIAGNPKTTPEGHPVSVFRKENLAVKREIELITSLFNKINNITEDEEAREVLIKVHSHFNNLMDIEKHYIRKENLLFPFLEKYQITGPSTVMWGKDDQVRKMLKEAALVLQKSHDINVSGIKRITEEILAPVITALLEMIQKEEEILFPMSLDTLTAIDWYEIYKQSSEIGFCLVDIRAEWKPEGVSSEPVNNQYSSNIQLPTGNFKLEELKTIFNTMPVDLTFVDKDDNVRFFSESPDRIFQRSRAILGRKVQYCHPPASVAIVEKILSDFKSGKQTKAAFWINMKGQFIHICYYALHGDDKEYIGTLEVSQNLTELRRLEGEKRILNYDEETIIDDEIKETENMNNEKVIMYDAREDLAQGAHPVDKVLAALSELNDDEKYLLITPFPPVPLIMKAKERGFSAQEEKISGDEYHTYFFK